MEDKANLMETLVERASVYGKSTFELAKLKALDKTSDMVSSIIPHSIVVVLIATFLLFFNLGLALWLGEILGKNYYGFLVIAAFYGVIGIIIHFFMHKSLKTMIGNGIIKQVLK